MTVATAEPQASPEGGPKTGNTSTFVRVARYSGLRLVTLQDGSPYANSDINQVKYLLYDATGAVVATGNATAMEDGHYQVTIGADVTGTLAAGADKIEVAVVPIPVAIPAYSSLDFVVVP